MELGPQNHNEDGLLGPNSRIVVYMDPLGYGDIRTGAAVVPVVVVELLLVVAVGAVDHYCCHRHHHLFTSPASPDRYIIMTTRKATA